MYPLAVLSHLQRRFLTWYVSYILGNCGHARSQGGRQPAEAKPPLHTYNIIYNMYPDLRLSNVCFL